MTKPARPPILLDLEEARLALTRVVADPNTPLDVFNTCTVMVSWLDQWITRFMLTLSQDAIASTGQPATKEPDR